MDPELIEQFAKSVPDFLKVIANLNAVAVELSASAANLKDDTDQQVNSADKLNEAAENLKKVSAKSFQDSARNKSKSSPSAPNDPPASKPAYVPISRSDDAFERALHKIGYGQHAKKSAEELGLNQAAQAASKVESGGTASIVKNSVKPAASEGAAVATRGGGFLAVAAGVAGSIAGLGLSALACVAAFKELNETTIKQNDEKVDQNRKLAQYSGKIARAIAQSDVADIRRDIETARATEDSVASMIQSNTRLKDSYRPIDNAFTNMGNRVDQVKNNAMSWVNETVSPAAKKTNQLLEKISTEMEEFNYGQGKAIEKSKKHNDDLLNELRKLNENIQKQK